MVTDEIVRREFIHQTISAGIKKIYAIQSEVINTELNQVTGELSQWVKQAPFSHENTGGNNTYYIRIPPYLRFLEIATRKRSDRITKYRRSKLSLYNRVVWRVFYRDTFPRIRYEYSTQVRNYIHSCLNNAIGVDPKQLDALTR